MHGRLPSEVLRWAAENAVAVATAVLRWKKGTGRGLPDRSRRRRPPRRRRAAAVGASSVAGASDGGAGIWQPDGVFVPRAKNERIWGRRKKKQL